MAHQPIRALLHLEHERQRPTMLAIHVLLSSRQHRGQERPAKERVQRHLGPLDVRHPGPLLGPQCLGLHLLRQPRHPGGGRLIEVQVAVVAQDEGMSLVRVGVPDGAGHLERRADGMLPRLHLDQAGMDLPACARAPGRRTPRRGKPGRRGPG